LWGFAKNVRGKELRRGSFEGWKVGRFEGWEVRGPAPWFLVSVASTGLRFGVSRLFAALARRAVSVASKGFTETDCWLEGNCVRADDFGEVRGTARCEGMKREARKTVPEQRSYYNRSVPIVK
jgi:hypothetical protein